MGHYWSEMAPEENKQEKANRIKKEKREDEIEKNICKVLKIKRGELKILRKILEESRNYSD